MHRTLTFLAENPLLLLTLLFAAGSALGRIRFFGAQLGPAAVLFAAIGVSAIGVSYEVELLVPEVVGTLGLLLFAYTVGIVSGPGFFASVRSNWRLVLSIGGVLAIAAAIAWGGGRLLDLPKSVAAGTFAGGLNNTPALAAASDASGDPGGATIGYSISYVWGVIGMLLVASWALRRSDSDRSTEPIVHRTIRVDRDDLPNISELESEHADQVKFSRVRPIDVDRPTAVPEGSKHLHRGDLVAAVGPRDVVAEVTEELGHTSSHDIVDDRRYELDFRRITISNPHLVGRPLGHIDLDRFGGRISRVRRGDVDMLAHAGHVVQMGDRVRVIAPRDRMAEVSRYLGDSARGYFDINPAGFGLGLLLGVLLGMIPIPLPMGTFTLGAPCGTLLVGLLFGRLGRVGPLMTSMSHTAAQALSGFGLVAFLAYAGTRAGQRFVSAISSDTGWKVAVLGFVITTSTAALVVWLARRWQRTDGLELAGVLGGTQTQPAILAFANDRADSDPRIGMGYALVYPAAMIVKILLAQFMVM